MNLSLIDKVFPSCFPFFHHFMENLEPGMTNGIYRLSGKALLSGGYCCQTCKLQNNVAIFFFPVHFGLMWCSYEVDAFTIFDTIKA